MGWLMEPIYNIISWVLLRWHELWDFLLPDGRFLGYTTANAVKKIDVSGGPPETLANLTDVQLMSGAWSRNGDIVLGRWGGGSRITTMRATSRSTGSRRPTGG